MIEQKYDLNLIPNTVPIIVPVSQYDYQSRELTFRLFYGDEPFTNVVGIAASIRGTKRDNTGFTYPATNITSSATEPIEVTFEITDQMTVFAGNLICEVRISKNSEVLGTANFYLKVEPTPLKDDTIISDTDIPLLQNAEGYALRAEAAAEEAERIIGRAVYSVNDVLPTGADNNVELNISDIPQLQNELNARAPLDHSTTATTYGLANTSKYGHVKLIDNLNSSSVTDGEALAAHQGYVLNEKIGNMNTDFQNKTSTGIAISNPDVYMKINILDVNRTGLYYLTAKQYYNISFNTVGTMRIRDNLHNTYATDCLSFGPTPNNRNTFNINRILNITNPNIEYLVVEVMFDLVGQVITTGIDGRIDFAQLVLLKAYD